MRERDQPAVGLPSLEAVDALPTALLPGFLAHLAALQAAVAGRLAMPAPAVRNGHDFDQLLTLDEAAKRLNTSPDWLRRHADRLPFTVRLSPGQLRYSSRAIERWIAARLSK